jgi:hypothetical protein
MAVTSSERVRKQYAERKSRGVCVKCGHPNVRIRKNGAKAVECQACYEQNITSREAGGQIGDYRSDMSGERCPRCRLRATPDDGHVCLPASAADVDHRMSNWSWIR